MALPKLAPVADPVYDPASDPFLRGRSSVPKSLAKFRNLKNKKVFTPPSTTLVQPPGVDGNRPPANYSIYGNSVSTSTPTSKPMKFDFPPVPSGLPARKFDFPEVPTGLPARKFAFPRPPLRAGNLNVENVTGLNLSGIPDGTGGSKRTRRKYKKNRKNKKTRRSRK